MITPRFRSLDGLALFVIGSLVAGSSRAQQAPDFTPLERARTHAPTPTTSAISVTDLRARLFLIADDSMGGRRMGSAGNAKTVDYVSREFARVGLTPAGDDHGWFQILPMRTRQYDSAAPLAFGDRPLTAWRDFVPRDQGANARSLDGVASIFGGVWGDSARLIRAEDAQGKLVVLFARPEENVAGGVPGLPSRPAVTAYFAGAAGVAVVGVERLTPDIIAAYRQPTEDFAAGHGNAVPSYLYITTAVAHTLFDGPATALPVGAPGKTIHGAMQFAENPYAFPARNVVGILPGSDPSLRAEYVAIGAHNDHIGIASRALPHDSVWLVNKLYRVHGVEDAPATLTAEQATIVNRWLATIRARTHGKSARADSINNGADDDGTGTVALLELAEYFAKTPGARPRRSLIFVSHVGEEEGLFGSTWFTDHPPVPRDAIVAQLNIDMIGRGKPDDVTGETTDGVNLRGSENYLQLVGSRRLSTELGDMIERVNRTSGMRFTFDYAMDANGHPANIYCRSDHYSYARFGIPVVFLTTGGHSDYHMVTDEPQYIDYQHMKRVVDLVRVTASRVGNLAHRPLVDKAVPATGQRCQQ